MNMSIVISTRNEEDKNVPLLACITKTLAGRASDSDVIFIDDGSIDRSGENIFKYRGHLQIRLICRDGVTGLATAVLAGVKVARGELLIAMDADLSHPPERIPDLLLPLKNGSHDMAISRSVAEFEVGLEILTSAGDQLRGREIQITFKDRRQGQSQRGTAVLFAYLRQLTALGGFPLETVDHKQLTVLTGIVVVLDILFFLLLQGAGLHLGFIQITSYLLACNLGYLVTATTTTTPLFLPSPVRPPALSRCPVAGPFLRGEIVALFSTWYPGKELLLPLAVACYNLIASLIGYLIVSSKINGKIQPSKVHPSRKIPGDYR